MAGLDMISGAGLDKETATAASAIDNRYWTKKYQGTQIDGTDISKLIVLPNKLKSMIKTAISNTGLGNYIFYSGPGTGKTSLALAIPGILGAKCVEVPPKRSSEILELINRYSVLKSNGKPYFFVLDECDHPNNPEDFWRNIQHEIEATSSNLRFILTCNDLWRIPKPVQSRCTPVKFNHPVDDKDFKNQIYTKLRYIADTETAPHGGKVDKHTIVEIINACYPDIRNMINVMKNTFDENEGNIIGHPHVITDQTVEAIAKYLIMRDLRGLRYYISLNVDDPVNVYIPLTRYLLDRLPPQMDLAMAKVTRDGIVNSQGQVDQESMLMGFFADLIEIFNAFQIPVAPLPEQPVYAINNTVGNTANG